jgi:LysM repeat protein/soluble lytic murein transglycosylase-like protein
MRLVYAEGSVYNRRFEWIRPEAHTMPECLTLTVPSRFPLRVLSIAVAFGLTSLLAGCSSTPATSVQTKKPVSMPSKKSATRVSGRTYGTTMSAGHLQASALDDNSVDALEKLLEATDMDAVEDSKLAVMRHGDLWTRMRAGFKLDLDVENSRINAQRSWFASRQPYIDRLTARASRYLYHTVTEAERRGIPTELALLPVIESSYDPAATSNAAAAGMWQFIPSTGKLYGLRQNDLYDGRRDVVESTRAAYDFLTSLYNQFGSWELALASYNAGPGRIQQAINSNAARGLPTDYWSLRLPVETMNYVPRFLAVAQIVRQPQRSNLVLPPIANRPHFRSVSLAGAVDLSLAGQMIGLSAKELYELNPAFRRGQTDPSGPHRLLIPNTLPMEMDDRLAHMPLLASGYVMGEQGGAVILSQSRGYTNAQAAALMGANPPSRVMPPNLSAQLTTRPTASVVGNPFSVGAPSATQGRVALPTNSAALAAMANQASLPSSTPRLVLPTDRTVVTPVTTVPVPTTSVSVSTRPTVVVAPVNTPVTPQAIVSAASVSVVAEPPLTAAERQRLMSEGLAAVRGSEVSTHITTTVRPVTPVVSAQIVPVAPNTGNEPALSAEEKAQVVAEIQQVVPAGTTVIDPLDGKIALTAIQTQQSVLDAKGQDRQVSYEKPYLNLPSRQTPSTTVATPLARPISMVVATAEVSKPRRPKGTRTIYTVQAGDSLTAVAARYGVDVDDLADWNQMARQANLLTGTPLYLYGVKAPVKPTTYVVQAGDTLSGLATRFGLVQQQLADYNDLSPTANLFAGRKLSLIETTATKSTARARKPVTEDYKVKTGESLIVLASRYRMSTEEFAKLNDLDADSSLQRGQILHVPAGVVDDSIIDSKAPENAKDKPTKANVRKPATETYTVKAGESLQVLAGRYSLSVDDLAQLNELNADQKLQRGQVLRVPVQHEEEVALDTKASDKLTAKGTSKGARKRVTEDYKVKAGESLIVLATRYGLTPDEFAKLNDFSEDQRLQRGQQVQVPVGSAKTNDSNDKERDKVDARSGKAKSKGNGPTLSYSVKTGDTLIGVANRYELDPAELARVNDLTPSSLLQRGQMIQVPDKGPKLIEYTVRSGDTLQRVAKKHGITLAQLAELNDIPTAVKLYEGDTINVPSDNKGGSR